MSFILDALKKSEAERQRQAGPTLLEVRVTRPRRRYPVWALVVGTLLGINAVLLVAFVLLHRPASPASERFAKVPASGGEAPQQTATGPAPAAKIPGPPPGVPGLPAPSTARNVGVTNTASSAAPSASAAAAAPIGPPAAAGSEASDRTPEQAAAAPSASLASAPPSSEARNPADDEPALPAGSAHVERAGPDNYANLPTLSELGSKVPALQLDLLDYSDRPSERYALINMHRVREGDVLPEGARVLAITRDGVALDYRGQDFLLRPGGSAP